MTYEEAIQYLKNINFCTGCPIDMSIDGGESCKVCEHRAFFEMAIDALDKQIPKKPIWHVLSKYKNGNVKNGAWKCPRCLRIEYVKRRDALDTYCGFCGQKIDYEGVEE